MGADTSQEAFEAYRKDYFQKKKVRSPEERESFRLQEGRLLFDAYYNRVADQPAYLNEDEQRAYLDKITQLARVHLRDSQDEEIQLLHEGQRAIENDEEFRMIERAFQGRKEKYLTQEQRDFYAKAMKFRTLPPDEVKRIGAKELAFGVEFLPPDYRSLYKRWEKNKYRGNWFASLTATIQDLAQEGFFDSMDLKAKSALIKRARDLDAKVTKQRGEGRPNEPKNKPEDVQEGDVLIVMALEQLFPSIQGLLDEQGNEARKKELQRLLGVEEKDTTDQSPRT